MLISSVLLTRSLIRCVKVPRVAALPFSRSAWGDINKPLIGKKEPIVQVEAVGRVYRHQYDLATAMDEQRANLLLSQTTSRVMMVEPTCFNYNPQTAKDNAFQRKITGLTHQDVHKRAMHEFNELARKLTQVGIAVNRTKDTQQASEDAVFPNNWISFHEDENGHRRIVLYPMMSERRRLERRNDLVSEWKHKLDAEVVDYTKYENEGKFLEGTGSMVLDRVNRVAYACESQRTHKDIFHQFCNDLGYTQHLFKSFSRDEFGQLAPIYHTNVMMSVGTTLAIVCLESIVDMAQREKVQTCLKRDGKTVVPITLEQVNHFAGNVLELRSSDNSSYLVMSTQAYNSFSEDQKDIFLKHVNGVIHSSLETIETLGGGGARCMLAEVFPPNDQN